MPDYPISDLVTAPAALQAREDETRTKGWAAVPEWVFCNEDGRPIWRSDFERRVYHKALAKAGLRRVRFGAWGEIGGAEGSRT
jgi:hypothetical protein